MTTIVLQTFGVLPEEHDSFHVHRFDVDDDRTTLFDLLRRACAALDPEAIGPSGEVRIARPHEKPFDGDEHRYVDDVAMHVPVASLGVDDETVFVAWTEVVPTVRVDGPALDAPVVAVDVPASLTVAQLGAPLSTGRLLDVHLQSIDGERVELADRVREASCYSGWDTAIGDLEDLHEVTFVFTPPGQSGAFEPVAAETSGEVEPIVDEPRADDDATVDEVPPAGTGDAPSIDDVDAIARWLCSDAPIPKINATVLLHEMDSERIGRIDVQVGDDKLVIKSRHKEGDVHRELEEFRRTHPGLRVEDVKVERKGKRWF